MNKQQALARLAILGGVILVIFLILSTSMFVNIDSGERGVLFKRFGGGVQVDQVYGEGFHIIAPWNSMFRYNVREQKKEEAIDVLSSDGLNIAVDVSCNYHPKPEMVGHLHQEIGPDYSSVIVQNLLRATVRTVIGRYTPEELYATKRDQITEEIYLELKEYFETKNIELMSVFVRSIRLPEKIEQAIQNKLSQQEEAKMYEYKIEREKREKERKMIEAEGIKEFQRIVSEGISDKLLKWKGIEATQELSKSNNTKIVIIGSGEDGLPIILGGDK